MNKKAQSLFDIIIFMVITLLMVVGFVVFKFVFHTATVQIQTVQMPSNIINFTDVTNRTFVNLDNGMSAIRYIGLAIIFGMIINILVSNFLIKVHPAFWLLYVGIVILAVILAVFISNAYESISADPLLSSTFHSFFEWDFIMTYLPHIIVVVGLIGGLFLFLGIQRDEGQGGGF